MPPIQILMYWMVAWYDYFLEMLQRFTISVASVSVEIGVYKR